ncbi:MAG: YceI family protein [Mycobacterium leprae]
MSKAKWVIDPSHSLVEFSVKHMMIATVKGRFGQFQGTILADLANLTTAEFEGTIEAASIDTRDAGRDEHLRSADFFDVAQFPQLTFKSKRLTLAGEDEFKLTGDLTMHGVTQEVVLDLTFEGQGKDPWGNIRAGFTAETRVNRKEFGLTWNAVLETGGVLVGDQVRIALQIEAIQQA